MKKILFMLIFCCFSFCLFGQMTSHSECKNPNCIYLGTYTFDLKKMGYEKPFVIKAPDKPIIGVTGVTRIDRWEVFGDQFRFWIISELYDLPNKFIFQLDTKDTYNGFNGNIPTGPFYHAEINIIR